MSNQIVSIRIPKSLTNELKTYAQENHYLDVSEVVRTLLRNKWLEYRDPFSSHVKGLRKDIASKVSKLNKKKDYKKLIEELDSIKKELVKKSGDTR